jgi:hypothetical protein
LSEEPVVVLGVKYVHQLEIDIILRFLQFFSLGAARTVTFSLLRGIATVAVSPPAVLDDTSVAESDAADTAYRRRIGTRMILALQAYHPLLKTRIYTYSETHLIPKMPVVKRNVGAG